LLLQLQETRREDTNLFICFLIDIFRIFLSKVNPKMLWEELMKAKAISLIKFTISSQC